MKKFVLSVVTLCATLLVPCMARADQQFVLNVPVSADLTNVTFIGSPIVGLQLKCTLFYNGSVKTLLGYKTVNLTIASNKVAPTTIQMSLSAPDADTGLSYTCAYGFQTSAGGPYEYPNGGQPTGFLSNVVTGSTFISRSNNL